MKRTMLALAILAGSLTPAGARGNHPMSGCGLGYILLSHDNHSKVALVLGATTDSTSGNQTFGITSGTSGCTEDGALQVVKRAEAFAEANFTDLRRDMAAGQGEYAEQFADLLGATDSNRVAWLRMFQAEYPNLFQDPHTTPQQLLERLTMKLAEHPEVLS